METLLLNDSDPLGSLKSIKTALFLYCVWPSGLTNNFCDTASPAIVLAAVIRMSM